MDSQDKDRTVMRQRDEALARRIGQALDEMDARNASHCPDGEILAAYAEQVLGQEETGKWESHFTSCSRCRKILLVLAASADTPLAEKEVAQLGERASAAPSPMEIAGQGTGRARPRIADWRVRWLAPALGLAAVLAVWFAMRPPWRAMDRSASPTLIAQAPKEEAPPSPPSAESDRFARTAPQENQKSPVVPPADRSFANGAPLPSPADAPAKRRSGAANEVRGIPPSAGAAASSLKEEKKSSSLQNEGAPKSLAMPAPLPPAEQAKVLAEAPPPVALPQARAQANVAAPSTLEAPGSTTQTVTVTGESPVVRTKDGSLDGPIPPEASADLPLNGREYQALANLHPAGDYTVFLKAASGSTLWRGGKGGIIERSTNAGGAWTPQNSPSQEDWLAGAAVSGTVCWLAGRNGAIARTVDGNQWERISPPAQGAAPAGKFPDWTGVAARDALNATIAAGDGRRFTTQDGGKTWQAQ